MAEFDPDAFLKGSNAEPKSSQSGGFDPDAFLKGKSKLYTPREPEDVSSGDVVGSILRGVATGVPGGLGSMEGFFTQTIPKLVGGKGAESTVLPTSEDYERYLQLGEKALGMTPGVKPETDIYRKGGELFGEALTPVGTIIGAGVKATKPLREAAKGKELQKALSTFGGDIESLAKTASQNIPKEAGEAINALIERSGQRRVNLTQAEVKRAQEIQAIREADAARYADLGKPSSTAKLGDEMQRRLTGTEFTREAARSQRAKEDAANYFKEAAEKNWGTSPEFADVMMNLREMTTSGKFNPDERKLAMQMYKDLQTTKDIEGVEKVFRKYNEASKGLPKEGYDAVTQQFSGSIADMLSKALNNFAPTRKAFRETYKDLSTPLDAYETSFGARGVAKEKDVPDRLQMMPTDYPGYYFQNRDTVRVLREQLAGDEAAVRKFATQHVVNELQGKNAQQAKQWLEKNGEWVNDIPGLNERVRRYVTNLGESEAKVGSLDQQINQIKSKRAEVGKRAETEREAITKLSDKQQGLVNTNYNFVKNATASEVPRTAQKMIDDMYQAKILNENEYSLWTKEINNIKQLATTKEEAARKIKYLISGAITGSAAFVGGSTAYGVRRAMGY